MVVHLLHLLHVVLILGLDRLLKLILQLLLVEDDLLALNDLLLDVLVQLLAVLLLLEFLPIPVDFDVLLVGSDNLVLDLVGTLALLFVFLNAALVFNVVSVGFDLSDCLVCDSANLLQLAFGFINLLVTVVGDLNHFGGFGRLV